MTKTKCPICLGEYEFIDRSELVCRKHQNWFVTKCEDCGKYVFSDCRGVCPHCARIDDRDDWDNSYKVAN